MDNIDNMNNFDDNDNVREPMPTIRERIIDKDYDFERSILENNNIDDDMKKILIQSRNDYINDFTMKLRFDPEIAKRSELLKIFSHELFKKTINNDMFKYLQLKIDKKINNYINNTIDIIELDFDDLYEIEIIINEMNMPDDIKEKLLTIFKPYDIEQYNDYKIIIEQSKQEYIELEKKNTLLKEEKIKRETLLNTVLINLNKLSKLDNSIKILKDTIWDNITDFIELRVEKIILNDNLRDDFIKFIKSIRMTVEDKNIIISLT